jgi:predicted amidohydrolase YtcJ
MSRSGTDQPDEPITVYRARQVRTMEPSMPTADAVAVRNGRIVEVGRFDDLRPWLDAHRHRIDDTFADRVMLPGLIDPHLHPSMAAVLLPMAFTTALPWRLPWTDVEAVPDRERFVARIETLDAELADGEPLFAWGHHPLWHGDIDRATLNDLVSGRPVVIWHRGYHSLIVNDACLEWMGLDLDAAARHPQIDLDRGAFFETGLAVANRHLLGHLLEPGRFRGGLERMRQVIHQGGMTTIGDAAMGLYRFEDEWEHLVAVMERPDTPFRIQLMPMGVPRGGESIDDMVERVAGYRSRNTHRLRFSDHVKLFADGAFFAELMMLDEPGHLDGRVGEWLTPPERFEELARALWQARSRIHVHCTGDLGVELALSTLETLQWERPRFDHRFTFEHFGISTAQQVDRMAAQGATASVNAYYLHELSRAYAANTLGYERASQMSRCGSLERAGVRFAVHSDFTMAPAEPLFNAWVVANRINEAGDVMCPDERVSLVAAMRSITIDAAYVLGLENEVGSLRSGKRADMTVVDADPFDVGADGLRDVDVLATVFEGETFVVG